MALAFFSGECSTVYSPPALIIIVIVFICYYFFILLFFILKRFKVEISSHKVIPLFLGQDQSTVA